MSVQTLRSQSDRTDADCTSPAVKSAWRHVKYGAAHVVAVSNYCYSGQTCVTVEFTAPGIVPARFVTYLLPDFHDAFEVRDA